MHSIAKIFNDLDLDHEKLKKIEQRGDPRKRYVIAITPRSGSSYLCDLMSKSGRFGTPGEALAQDFIPRIARSVPARTPGEYLRNVFRARKSPNGVSGIKASWFQFKNFIDSMEDQEQLRGIKYVYLMRRDLEAQAVSLYKATASSVFHTNVAHDEAALQKLDALEYDFAAINDWYKHIVAQEQGWKRYFFENRIFPLCVSYEDINEDVLLVMQRIATFVGVKPENVVVPEVASVFEKVSDARNVEWADRFLQERRLQQETPQSGTSTTKVFGWLGRLKR